MEKIEKFYFNDFSRGDKSYYMADLVLTGDEKTTEHNHDYYEFFFVVQGTFGEKSNGKISTLKRKQMHVLSPDDRHMFYAASEEKTSILRNIAIEAKVFENILSCLNIDPASICGYYTLDENTFASYLNKTDLIYGFYPDGIEFDFLMNNLLSDMIITARLRKDTDYHIPKWLKNVYTAMEEEENYTAGFSRMLELSGKSKEHLTRSFKLHYQMTPTHYINLVRLQNAASMLTRTNDRIIDIIYSCGYNSISLFNRKFKAHYGVTPQEYRKNKNRFFNQ